ncbi:SPFH domain-containing protein [Dysgonomonas sp. 520]|uniref:SPFH domain-containing protein n=1 Tax=Dysgonomonas sp. 520 TaxID=2302931 RepID=UPI0013D86F51|nr:SPFH domain-containing protein [Dysgonomonas sp. 520]NDW10704.1 DUF4339 domain-containing protein [Dysgonomonas sp. 520]
MSTDINIQNETIDTIKFDNNENNIISYRFDRHGYRIKYNATISVPEDYQAIFFHDKETGDIFSSGEYQLNENSLPIFSALQSWRYTYNRPFEADIFFFSTARYKQIEWSAKPYFALEDKDQNKYEIYISGLYSFNVSNPVTLIQSISGQKETFCINDMNEILLSLISKGLKESLLKTNKLSGDSDEISELLYSGIKNQFEKIGIGIFDFDVKKITITTIKKEAEPVQSIRKTNNPDAATPKYYIVIDKKQAGPFDPNELKQLCFEGKLSKKTLVWKKGLSNWVIAEEQSDLNYLWN